jgi:thiol:disulfide interchange protein DsbD
LFGLFEVLPGGKVMSAASGLASKEGYPGAFFNGALATILATPCTAPFLAPALGWAFTQSPVSILTVFLAVGAGLAFPFVALCWKPGWLKLLPKPGVWMERFKVAMGFPMLATAVWLFWFTAPQFGSSGVLWFGLFLVLLALSAWIWGEFVQRGSKRRGLAIAFAVFFLAAGYTFILENKLNWRMAAPATSAGSIVNEPGGIDWQPWSQEAVAAARSEGKPVLVDFTAKTCVNCQINKATSIEIPSTREKLKQVGAVALRGDFTNHDQRIAEVLKQYKRPGVPLVLVYSADSSEAPIVLPTILTPGIVSAALDKVATN